MSSNEEYAQQILDKALELAQVSSWEPVRLHDVPREMGISLNQIREHYRQKDDLVEAWFDRADAAMLEDAMSTEYLLLSVRDRIHRSIICWLNSMSSYRQITGEMLLYKLEFGHVHLQMQGIMRISRTVQWILEAAKRDATHLRRVLEEVAVTTIYLATFTYWLRDNSLSAEKTSAFLNQMLSNAEALSGFLLLNSKYKRPQTEYPSSVSPAKEI